MNFQQILKIPLYLKIIETVYKSDYIYGDEDSVRDLHFMPKIVNLDDTFYIKKYDNSLIPIDYNIIDSSHIDVFNYSLLKCLITIKVFEDTDKNPLGMYMLDHIKIPEHYKSSYRLKEIHNYVDHDLYNTLLIIDKK